MTFNAAIRWRDRRYGWNPRRPTLRPSVGSGLVISWAGMRAPNHTYVCWSQDIGG